MKKNKKQKRPLSASEKEQKFITISTRILLAITIAVAILYAGIFISKQFKNSDLTVLGELTKTPDTSQFLTHQITDENLTSLRSKIDASGLDIIEDDAISYNKFNNVSIAMTDNISLTSNEFGMLYNSLYLSNDKYSTVLQQVDITTDSEGYTLKIVATIDFKKLFPKEIDNMPARIYVISESKIKNGVITPLSTLYNNMDVTTSNQLTNILNESTSGLNIQSYIPNLVVNLAKNLSQRTNTNFDTSDNKFNFSLKTA